MVKFVARKSVPLDSLHPYPGNPRVHADALLVELVKAFGQTKAILVRQHDVDEQARLTILAGHGIHKAMLEAGLKTARVDILDATDDEARRIVLSDNRASDLASDDQDLTIAQLEALDGDYSATGWSEDDYLLLTREEQLPDGGDAPQDELTQRFGVIVECGSEADQVALLSELADRGLNVRAIVA